MDFASIILYVKWPLFLLMIYGTVRMTWWMFAEEEWKIGEFAASMIGGMIDGQSRTTLVVSILIVIGLFTLAFMFPEQRSAIFTEIFLK